MFNIFKKSKPAEKQKILFFCGAGLSAESGLSTFRDSKGLWANHDIDEVCNLKTFKTNKQKVFKFYNDRKSEILNVKPNIAHFEIAKIQQKYGAENVHVFTSNIDNLLEKAGCKQVCYVHGTIFQLKCLNCEHEINIGNAPFDVSLICPQCKTDNLKPNIIFFNEPAPQYKLLREYFEKGGPIIKQKIVGNIKVIVGSSLKVIKPEIFKPSRGRTIIVDKNEPELHDYKNDFEKIIIEPATTGLKKVSQLIDQWYVKS